MQKNDNYAIGRSMPNNQDAEVGFLGSIFAEARNGEAELLDQAIGMNVNANWFFGSSHAIIWDAIRSVYHQAHIAPELVAVTEFLSSTDQLELIGGYHTLTEIESRVETSTWGKQFLKTVKVFYERRMLIRANVAAVEAAYEPLRVDEKLLSDEFDANAQLFKDLEEAVSMVRDLSSGQVSAVADFIHESVADIVQAKAYKGAPTGQRTGIQMLDITTTGFQPGEMIILAARPSMGKSALAGEWARFASLPSKFAQVTGAERSGALVFSYEMGKKEYVKRMLSSMGRFNLRKVHDLKEKDLDYIKDLALELKSAPLFIEDDSSMDVFQMAARARQVNRVCQKTYGCRLGLIVVDYVQLMPGHTRAKTREEAVAMNSRGLKQLAMKQGVPVVALSQLNRELEKEKRFPRLSDLRECLPIDAWISTPYGPVQMIDRPTTVCTNDAIGAKARPCEFIPKKYNSVYELKTVFGTVRATARHLILTGTGWKKMRDINPQRDVIASPHEIKSVDSSLYVPHARLLGWMLGNGGFYGTPSLAYRNELDSEVRREVAKFSVSVRPRKAQNSPNIIDAYLSNGVESGCLPNPLMEWIRSLGLEGHTAENKFIPKRYLLASTETKAELLRGLWETDGTVTGGCAKFATCCELLARQVAWLLHTLRVRSNVSFEPNDTLGLWTVRVSQTDNDKLRDLEICCNPVRFGELSRPNSMYVDPCPAIVVEYCAEMAASMESARRFQKRKDGTYKAFTKLEAIEFLGNNNPFADLPFFSINGMGWGRIISKKKLKGEVRVADLSVPGTNSFVADGILVHNSGSLEQDADIVLLLGPRNPKKENILQDAERELILQIAKQRNGPLRDILLDFIATELRVTDDVRNPGD